MSETPFQSPPQGDTPPQSQQFSQDIYDVPVESIPLPSKGLVYPPEHPLCNVESVEIKTMTAKEEDLLTSQALIKNGTVISRLIQSCLLNKTIDPDSLLTGDRNALLIAIRITGYGSEYSARIQCPECSEEFEQDFVLKGLKLSGLGAEPLEPNCNKFKFELPRTKKEVVFRLLTGADEAEMSTDRERRKKLGDRADKDVTSRLLRSVLSVAGEEDPSKVSRFVTNMPAADSRALRGYINEISPDVKMKQYIDCVHCGEESEVNIPLGISFFWPDIE